MRHGISVVIPVYNGARYLPDCLRSVRNQTLPAAEIIVIDDGSEDDTPKVAAAWAPYIRYRRVVHGGRSHARNHGVRCVETDFIAFIDSDDIWLPRKLELQMVALSRETEPAMIFGYMQQFVSSDLTLEEAAKLKYKKTPLPGPSASTLFMRKGELERVGLFDESINVGEFIEWFSRAKDLGIRSVLVPEVVCRRRLHLNNTGRGGAALHGSYAFMLKKVLNRRRKSE
jgi:glycosyltransferase involved in cell wall biosynthesis